MREGKAPVPPARGFLPFAILLLVGGCGLPAARWASPVTEPLVALAEDSRVKPVVLVDLDDTVVDGGLLNSLRLVLGFPYSSVPPLEGAPQSLRGLEAEWSIVFLTTRAQCFKETTLGWLDHHHFPRAPVIFASRPILTCSGREEFKSHAIAAMKQQGVRVLYGVGDKATDIRAYLRNGVKAILILDGPDDPDLRGVLPALRDPALISFWKKEGWPEILRYLQGVSPQAPAP